MARTKTSRARCWLGRLSGPTTLALVLLAAGDAAADERATGGLVLVIRTPPPRGVPEAEERARAELVATGLAVELRASDDAVAPSLADDVRGTDAVAAVRLLRGSPGGAPLVLTIAAIERASGNVRLYDYPLGEPAATMTAARAGLLVAEHLYALRQEIRWPTPVRAEASLHASAPPPPPPTPATNRAPWSFRAGVLAFAAADVVRPGVAIGVAAPLVTWTSLALVLDLDLSATAMTTPIDAAAGSTSVRFGAARASMGVTGRGRFAPFALLGGGGLFAQASARPAAPYGARDDEALVGFAATEVGVAFALSSTMAVRLAAAVTRALPPMRVQLGAEEAARVGSPALVAASLALAWSPR